MVQQRTERRLWKERAFLKKDEKEARHHVLDQAPEGKIEKVMG